MKIVSFWDEKGGCGKSTLAFMLAGAAAAKGLSVLLVDDDPQGTCYMLSLDNNIDFKVCMGWPEEPPENTDLVIVDMAPNTNDVPAGIVILPYQPTRVSYSVAAKHIPALKEKSERLIEVITMADIRIRDHKDFCLTNKALKVASRSVYQRATNNGTTIFSPMMENVSDCRKARKEINALLTEVLK